MDVTILVQGPLHENLLKSIPNYIKYANVVISTWNPKNDTETNLLQVLKFGANQVSENKLKIIHYEDVDYNWFNRNNLYKQTTTTLNGLKEIKSDYVIKLRSDCYFENLEPILLALHPYKLVHSNIHNSDAYPFHISDYIIGSKKQALIRTFSLVETLCRYTPKLGEGLPYPGWFSLDFECPVESIIMSCYLRSYHIFPDHRFSKEILNVWTEVIEYTKLGKYYFISNNLQEINTNIS